LQIARICEAMIVARTMMTETDRQAMDRFISLTGELDRTTASCDRASRRQGKQRRPGESSARDARRRPRTKRPSKRRGNSPACKPLKSLKMELDSSDRSIDALGR
jgi:hypothetical protein